MKISIIIPIYNVEPYIEECLQSVANQSMTDGVECILVDDCGSDNSMFIVKRFVKQYNGPIPFKILFHEHNLGLSEARNTGIRAAQGEYIFFLDSDDKISEDCVEKLLAIERKHKGIDLIQGLYVWTTRPFINELEFTSNRRIIKSYLLDYDIIPVNAQNKLVRRKLILDNDLFFMKGIIHEDNQWNYHLAKYVTSFMICSNRIYYYYTRPGSICTTINIEKEKYSHELIIRDYCDNIDDFCLWSQKRTIALMYSTIVNLKYYNNANSLKEISAKVREINSSVEWTILNIWMKLDNRYAFIKKQLFKLLIFLYKINS